MITMGCAKCGASMDFEVGAPIVLNLRNQSMVVIDHPNKCTCLMCGAEQVVAIRKISSIELVTVLERPASTEEQRIVVPN